MQFNWRLHYRLNEWINSRFRPVLLVVATLRETERGRFVFVTAVATIIPLESTLGELSVSTVK